jgi:hypothetical protein
MCRTHVFRKTFKTYYSHTKKGVELVSHKKNVELHSDVNTIIVMGLITLKIMSPKDHVLRTIAFNQSIGKLLVKNMSQYDLYLLMTN